MRRGVTHVHKDKSPTGDTRARRPPCAGFGEAFFHKWGFSLGWQGIIPSKAEKMARKACQMLTTKLISLHEIFDKVEPHRIVQCLEPVLHKSMERVITEVRRTWPAPSALHHSLHRVSELLGHRWR